MFVISFSEGISFDYDFIFSVLCIHKFKNKFISIYMEVCTVYMSLCIIMQKEERCLLKFSKYRLTVSIVIILSIWIINNFAQNIISRVFMFSSKRLKPKGVYALHMKMGNDIYG